jgi:hypothetical protein
MKKPKETYDDEARSVFQCEGAKKHQDFLNHMFISGKLLNYILAKIKNQNEQQTDLNSFIL